MKSVVKYIHIFTFSIRDSLEYRFNLVTIIVMNMFPIIVNFYLWKAILYSDQVMNPFFGELPFEVIVAYIIMINALNILLQTSVIDSKMQNEIRQGIISNYLLRPVNYYFYNLSICISKFILFIVPFMILGFGVETVYLNHTGYSISHYMFLILAFLQAYFLRYTISFLCGVICFYFEDLSQFFVLTTHIVWFFSGVLFPLFILPDNLYLLFKLLPFYYISYYPCCLLVGIETEYTNIIFGTIWLILLLFAVNSLWKLTIKHYSAFGG